MSYSTWVLSGQPTLDKDHKTIQACGKSVEECLGLAKTVIHINSQPLEGYFYVMRPKYLQKELVLGRQLTEIALCLQKSQAIQEECQQKAKTGGGITNQGPRMTETSLIKDGIMEMDTNEKMSKEKQTAQENDKSHGDGKPKATLRMQEPAKDTVTEATKADGKNSQRLVQQWVKKKQSLKGDNGINSSCAKPDEPQEQSRPPTEAPQEQMKTRTPTNAQTTNRHNNIWVPRKVVQAQQGATHIWVPKRATSTTCQPTPKSHTSKRRQARYPTTRNGSQKHKQPKRARKERYQGTIKRHDILPNHQQVWVTKALLKAQGDSTYKWVPKNLIRQATSPTKKPAVKKQSSPQRQWPEMQTKEQWIPRHVLAKKGYYEGATHIWVPKHKAIQTPPKQQTTSQERQPSNGQTWQKWITKTKEGTSITKQPTEASPQNTNEVTKVVRKATTKEKGKWIPKVAATPTISHEEQLPSTSNSSANERTTHITEKQSQIRPFSGTSHLDMARQLAFILRTFNSKKVEAKWRQYMATKVTGNVTLPAEALGPNLLQDPPLAPH